MEDIERNVTVAQAARDRWSAVEVVPQYSESSDEPAVAGAKWARIYRLFQANGEAEQDAVFAAVNMYFLRNGCSPEGSYSKPIRTAGGVEVDSGDVVKITGKLEGEIRRFMRGRLEDSYNFLKYNPGVLNDDDLRARAESLGVPSRYRFLLADWLGSDCRYFVGEEADIYAGLRNSLIARAKMRKMRGSSPTVANGVVATAPDAVVRREETQNQERPW